MLDWRRELREEGVPDRDPTVAELAEEWLGVVRGRVKLRTAVRYEQLLRLHVLPVIGGRKSGRSGQATSSGSSMVW